MSEEHQRLTEENFEGKKETPKLKHKDTVSNLAKWFKINIHMSEEHPPSSGFGKLQHKIGEFIESRPVQYFLILLLVIDIVLLLSDLTLEAAFNRKF